MGHRFASMDSILRPSGTEAVVRFTTKLSEKYQIPEDQLVLPSNLKRYGLSEVVNRLLDFDTPVPFDFLVNGEFLRTSVYQYLEANNLSSEKVLELEYVLALREPEESQVDEVPDWVYSVHPLKGFPSEWFVAASGDGTVRVYEGNVSRLVTKLSDSPLTSIVARPVDGAKDASDIFVAGHDGKARCCRISCSDGNAAEAGPVAELAAPGMLKSLQTVSISGDGTMLASGGWGHDISIWNADSSLFLNAGVNGGKRKKPSTIDSSSIIPKFSFKGHTQVVSALQFGTKERFPFTLLSASWDSSIRVWDLAAAECVCNWTVARAVTSFSLSPAAESQICTSHEDGHVSLWDIRAPPHPTLKGAFSLDATSGLPLTSAQAPHRRKASQAAWCPMDQYRIASVGHDGLLCILDPRSPKMPLQQSRIGKKEPGGVPVKLLSVSWLSRNRVVTGGSDGKVVTVSLNGPNEVEGAEN